MHHVISSFNSRKIPGFNESYNKAMGVHNMIEHAFLSQVQYSCSGIMKLKLKRSDIEDFLSYNTWKPSESLIKHANREGLSI